MAIYDLVKACVLLANALAIINHRFLRQIGWDSTGAPPSGQYAPPPSGGESYDQMGMEMGQMGGYGGQFGQPIQQQQPMLQQQQAAYDENSAKARIQSLLGDRNVKLILRVPLIVVNFIFIFLELLMG